MPAKFLGEGLDCEVVFINASYTDEVVLGLYFDTPTNRTNIGDELVTECCNWLDSSPSANGEYDWNLRKTLDKESNEIQTHAIFYFTDTNTAFEFKLRFVRGS